MRLCFVRLLISSWTERDERVCALERRCLAAVLCAPRNSASSPTYHVLAMCDMLLPGVGGIHLRGLYL